MKLIEQMKARAAAFRDDKAGATNIGRVFGILLLFVFIIVLAEVIHQSIVNSTLTGTSLLIVRLIEIVFLGVGIMLALKEADVL
jgi:hypothetical protein